MKEEYLQRSELYQYIELAITLFFSWLGSLSAHFSEKRHLPQAFPQVSLLSPSRPKPRVIMGAPAILAGLSPEDTR